MPLVSRVMPVPNHPPLSDADYSVEGPTGVSGTYSAKLVYLSL